MGQKVHPKAFRLNTVTTWDSRWFFRKRVPETLAEDVMIRKFLQKTLRESAVDRIEIERTGNSLTIIVHTAKPGFIIGRAGAGAEELKSKLIRKVWGNVKTPAGFNLNIVEVPKPGLSAAIAAEQAAIDTEKRMPYRRVLKQVIDRAKKSGALGVKVRIAGRLGGAEIARREVLAWGKIPLHNLRADIDYAERTAYTVYGTIGVKVWIYRGEVFEKDKSGSPPSVSH